MILLVDVGNTRVKWLLWTNGQVVQRGHLVHKGVQRDQLAEQLWSALKPPQRVVIANVAGPEMAVALTGWITAAWSIQTRFVTCEAAGFGIRNAYAVPQQMGIDRWVAMIGAWNRLHQACCIIDCGTAITIDALSATGLHLGGVIFPGIRLMRESLYRDTSQIPEDHDGQAVLLGKSTRDCVWGGTVYAVAAAIDGIVAQMSEVLEGKVYCILTGGDAETLLPYLRGQYQLEPDIIFHGLLVMATQ